MGERILLSPNHTQVSNEFIEQYMGVLSGSAVKVFLAICRKTIGWHKETDAIAYPQIIEMTGIGSRSTVKKAVDELLAKNLISVEVNKGVSVKYTLSYATSTVFEEGSTESVPPTSTESVLTKETPKETIQKKIYKRNLHPTLKLPYQPTRYKNLCEDWEEGMVIDYMQRAKDYADAHNKPYKDYAAAAATFIRRDEEAGKIVRPKPKERIKTFDELRKEYYGE